MNTEAPILRSVVPRPDYLLELEFENGERRVFDVKPYLDKGIFSQLKDIEYFKRVTSSSRYVSWPCEQDFSLDTLWARSV